jgi:hypothetical protein
MDTVFHWMPLEYGVRRSWLGNGTVCGCANDIHRPSSKLVAQSRCKSLYQALEATDLHNDLT